MRSDPRFDAFGDNRRQCEGVKREPGDPGRRGTAEVFNQPDFPSSIEEECGAQHERDRDSCHLIPVGAKAEEECWNESGGNHYYDSISIEKRGTGMGEKNADAERNYGEATEQKSKRAECCR